PGGEERTGAEQVVFGGTGGRVAKVDQPDDTPAPVVASDEQVLGRVLAGQQYWWSTGGGRVGGTGEEGVEGVDERGWEPTLAVARHAAGALVAQAIGPARLEIDQRPGRHALDLRDERADLREEVTSIDLVERRPHVVQRRAGEAAHDQVRPTI